MAQNIKLEEMIQSGMHFGHFTREWNPRNDTIYLW